MGWLCWIGPFNTCLDQSIVRDACQFCNVHILSIACTLSVDDCCCAHSTHARHLAIDKLTCKDCLHAVADPEHVLHSQSAVAGTAEES